MKWWHLLKAISFLFFFYQKNVTSENKFEAVNINMDGFAKKKRFFLTKFYNVRLTKQFNEEDYHFFCLVFIKLLHKTGSLNKNNSIQKVKFTLEHMEFGINQTSDVLYMTLVNEIKHITSPRYQLLYENKQIEREISSLVEDDEYRKKLLTLIPFSSDKIYISNENYKKTQLLLDMLHLSIVITYKNLNESTKKEMLKVLYENKIDQWMSLNFLRKIMKYKLMINQDQIVSYLIFQRNADTSTNTLTEQHKQQIEQNLKDILQAFINKLFPNNLGNADSGYFIDEDTHVFMPNVQVVGYMTSTQQNFHVLIKDSIQAKSIEFFKKEENRNKIIIQILISYPTDSEKQKPKENDITITIEYCYNILINYFHYNNHNFLSYQHTNIYASYLSHGKSPFEEYEQEEKNKEKKYEDLSLHIFLKIKKKMPFTFKHIQKFIKNNTKHIQPDLYVIHFYGACYKSHNNDIVRTLGLFGESVDNNFINIVMLEMKSGDIIAHVKLYTQNSNKKKKIEYLSANNIKKKLDDSQVFDVLYYTIDSTKEIPKPIDCTKCREKKYHYAVLLAIAVVPSFLIFLLMFIYYYVKTVYRKDKVNGACTICCSNVFPCLFYVKVSSKSFLRLDKKRKDERAKKKKSKTVLNKQSKTKSRISLAKCKLTKKVYPDIC